MWRWGEAKVEERRECGQIWREKESGGGSVVLLVLVIVVVETGGLSPR
jgi:hypothetical protein